MHSSEEGRSFKQPSRIFFLECEEFSSCFSEFGESEMNSPDFSLILKPVLANELEFVIDSLLFVGSSRCLECGGVCVRIKVQFR